MVIYFEKDDNLGIEVFNGAADMLEKLKTDNGEFNGISNIMLRSGEMFIPEVKNKNTLIDIAAEIIRTDNACVGLPTYWKGSEHFRSKSDIATLIRNQLDISDDTVITCILCTMLPSVFYDKMTDDEIAEEITTAYHEYLEAC